MPFVKAISKLPVVSRKEGRLTGAYMDGGGTWHSIKSYMQGSEHAQGMGTS